MKTALILQFACNSEYIAQFSEPYSDETVYSSLQNHLRERKTSRRPRNFLSEPPPMTSKMISHYININ